MTVTVKTKSSSITVPAAVRQHAGFKVGQVLEIKATGANVDDEYTPEQRRIIDVQLVEARKGPYYGPFDTANEMMPT